MNHHLPASSAPREHAPAPDIAAESGETSVHQADDDSAARLLFRSYHDTLQNDYRDAEGGVIDCRDIALSIWKALRSEGRHSRIVTVVGKDAEGNRTKLLPVPYEGKVKVEWEWHAICDEKGLVHDPILPEPTPLDTYLTTAFQQEVEIEDRLPM